MAETIKDLIATLGFKIEKAEEARFNAALDKLAKTVTAVAASLTAAAASITATVVAVSSQFDQLYFATQRSNTTVANMKALQYAFTQVGGTAQQASSVLDGLATALRTNPQGIEGFLKSIGVASRENGRLRDTADILKDIGTALPRQGQYSTQAQMASLLGIDEKTWQVYTAHQKEIADYEKKSREAYAGFGVDPDKAAETSNKLMTSIRALMQDVSALVLKIVVELQPKITEVLNGIGEWFKAHKDDIVSAINTLIGVVVELTKDFGALLKALEPVGKAFAGLSDSLGDKSGGMKTALEAVAAYMAGSWLARIFGAASKASGFFGLLLGGLFLSNAARSDHPHSNLLGQEYLSPVKPGALKGTPEELAKNIPGPGETLSNVWNGVTGWLGKTFGSGKTRYRAPDAKMDEKPGAKTDGTDNAASVKPDVSLQGVDPRLAKAIQTANAAEKDYDVKVISGYRPEDPRLHGRGLATDIALYDKKTGQKLDNYQNPADVDAYKAYAENLHKIYEQQNPGQGDDLRWGGYFLGQKGTYGAFDLMHHDLGGALGMGMAGGSWKNGFSDEQKKIWGLSDKSSTLMNDNSYLGGATNRSANLSAKTDITIFGSSDPAGTAAGLNHNQSRQNAELIRNAQSAFA